MSLVIGDTVPWNASWSGEDGGYEIRPCRWAEGKRAIWQAHRPGCGRPLFAKPHFVRQRRSIAQMLCTVCGAETVAGNRWWFGFGQVLEGYFLTTESPVHRTCAEHAMKACPVIARRKLVPHRFPEGAVVVAAMIAGAEVEKDFGLRIPPERAVVGSLKLGWRLDDARLIPGVAQFLREDSA